MTKRVALDFRMVLGFVLAVEASSKPRNCDRELKSCIRWS